MGMEREGKRKKLEARKAHICREELLPLNFSDLVSAELPEKKASMTERVSGVIGQMHSWWSERMANLDEKKNKQEIAWARMMESYEEMVLEKAERGYLSKEKTELMEEIEAKLNVADAKEFLATSLLKAKDQLAALVRVSGRVLKNGYGAAYPVMALEVIISSLTAAYRGGDRNSSFISNLIDADAKSALAWEDEPGYEYEAKKVFEGGEMEIGCPYTEEDLKMMVGMNSGDEFLNVDTAEMLLQRISQYKEFWRIKGVSVVSIGVEWNDGENGAPGRYVLVARMADGRVAVKGATNIGSDHIFPEPPADGGEMRVLWGGITGGRGDSYVVMMGDGHVASVFDASAKNGQGEWVTMSEEAVLARKLGLPENREYRFEDIKGIQHLLDKEGNLMAVKGWSEKWVNLEEMRGGLIEFLKERDLRSTQKARAGSLVQHDKGVMTLDGFVAGVSIANTGSAIDLGGRGEVVVDVLMPIYIVDDEGKLLIIWTGIGYTWTDKQGKSWYFEDATDAVPNRNYTFMTNWWQERVGIYKTGDVMRFSVFGRRSPIATELRGMMLSFLGKVWPRTLGLGGYDRLTEMEMIFTFEALDVWREGNISGSK